MNEVVVGVDIGSSKVCTILGQLNKNSQLQILGVGTSQCKGLKKGIIVDIDSVAQAILSSIKQAEGMSDMEIKSAFINIPGGHASLLKNRGVIAVSGDDGGITRDDVERVLQQAKVANIPIEREIIGIIPLQFVVDGFENIKDPVGMVGASRLEVDAYIITAPTSTIQNYIRCVERCNVDVLGVIVDPLASADVILTKEEKEMGVAIVDIGGETTDISIFKDSTLVYTKLLPVGGMHITNDISVVCKIPVMEAEQLKRQYGCASLSLLDSEENISLSASGISHTKNISNRELTDIIEARVQEIFSLVNRELEASNYKGDLSGIVLTGGGVSFLKGANEVASSILDLHVRTGIPKYIGVASPVYSTATGMVKYILSSPKLNSGNNILSNEENKTKPKRKASDKSDTVINKIRDFFSDFF